ncbi:MAG: ACT domain-containing protein [Oscillospiraceae bacterium]|nr:ACT domain-containing protein [Oscillospiraceae bacterium]
MAYSIKYIENCPEEMTDISPLYNQDLLNGERVILVCGKETANRYISHEIRMINSPADAASTDAPLMMLCVGGNIAMAAIECAYALYAGRCQVYGEYDGLYTTNPLESQQARRIEKIDYDEVIEVSTVDYNKVDASMVEIAKKRGIAIHILSYSRPQGQGTVIKEVLSLGTSVVKGVMKEPEICIVSLMDIPDVPGAAYRIFQIVSDAGVVVDMISLPASDYGSQDISFTINKEDKHIVKKILEEKQEDLGFSKMILKDNVAKISVVGSGVQGSKGVAASVFKILYENDINLRLISTSEIKISVIVDKSKADLAVHKIHEVFIK